MDCSPMISTYLWLPHSIMSLSLFVPSLLFSASDHLPISQKTSPIHSTPSSKSLLSFRAAAKKYHMSLTDGGDGAGEYDVVCSGVREDGCQRGAWRKPQL
ncbi:uncharacterized protein EDB91DRAFT_1140832, partial [Suillus paluster]|uniref:uncharacterized protein n=1 Tax=Suillus paluster TaxID=48578 RepID=UPI001B88615F